MTLHSLRPTVLFPTLLSSVLLLAAAALHADDTTPVDAATVDTIKAQLANHQAAEAYRTAEALRAAQEGDPAFDLWYGIAALQSSHIYEARYALERVVYAEPENMFARFQLAKAYQQLGDAASAEREFKLVQASNPPADVAREIDNYLNGKQGKTLKSSVTGSAELAYGHDSNINSGTHEQFVNGQYSYITPAPINASAREQADLFDAFYGKLQYFQPVTENFGIATKAGVIHKNNFSSDEFDETIYNFDVSLNQKIGNNLVKLSGSGQNYQLNSHTRSNMVGGDLTWEYQPFKNTLVAAGAARNEITYPEGNGLMNVQQDSQHFSVTQHIWTQYHTIGYIKSRELADNRITYNPTWSKWDSNAYNARNSDILYYDLNWYMTLRNSLQLRLLWEYTDHGARDPIWQANREDKLRSLNLAWLCRLNNSLAVDTRLGYTTSSSYGPGANTNPSQFAIYGFSRTYIQTGIKYSF